MDVISFSEAATANSRIEKINANPDSSSGIVTVPKVIASTETVTIPAGRVAVLPNLVIDGVLNIENGGEVFVPSGATLGDLDAQLALKADTSYVNTQLVLKANTTDLKEIGVGQTWQDMTLSRFNLTTYTNTTGKPIMVNISTSYSANADIMLFVGGLPVSLFLLNSTAQCQWTASTIIPNNTSYYINKGDSTSFTWLELR